MLYEVITVLVKPNSPWKVEPANILYKCGWSPLEGVAFSHTVSRTFVNGQCVFDNGKSLPVINSMRLMFNR